MRSICLALLMIGCTHALQTQTRPVYQGKSGLTPPAAAPPAVKQAETPAPGPPAQAQAREGSGVADTAPSATGTAPNSQNYLVYYYPEYRTGATQTTGAVTQQPYATGVAEPGFFQRIPWVDVGYMFSTLILVGTGGALLYNVVGTQVKSRALRELKDITYDDASQMARRVLRAIEKFQNINVEQE